MYTRYHFSEDQLTVFKRAQAAFNAFTGNNYTLHEYIEFVMQQVVAGEISRTEAIEEINAARNNQIKLSELLENGTVGRAQA
jgi:hypothetical protein